MDDDPGARSRALALAEACLRRELSPEAFAAALSLECAASLPRTPRDPVAEIVARLAHGRAHPDGFAWWLRAALPHMIRHLRQAPDELAMHATVSALWSADGYFDPSVRSDLVRVPLTRWPNAAAASGDAAHAAAVRALLATAGAEPTYAIHIQDPDNALSLVHEVRRVTSLEALAERVSALEEDPAPQGGWSYLVLAPASLRWLLVHASLQDDALEIELFAEPAVAAAFAPW